VDAMPGQWRDLHFGGEEKGLHEEKGNRKTIFDPSDHCRGIYYNTPPSTATRGLPARPLQRGGKKLMGDTG
jgi:hypothetical protein